MAIEHQLKAAGHPQLITEFQTFHETPYKIPAKVIDIVYKRCYIQSVGQGLLSFEDEGNVLHAR